MKIPGIGAVIIRNQRANLQIQPSVAEGGEPRVKPLRVADARHGAAETISPPRVAARVDDASRRLELDRIRASWLMVCSTSPVPRCISGDVWCT